MHHATAYIYTHMVPLLAIFRYGNLSTFNDTDTEVATPISSSIDVKDAAKHGDMGCEWDWKLGVAGGAHACLNASLLARMTNAHEYLALRSGPRNCLYSRWQAFCGVSNISHF